MQTHLLFPGSSVAITASMEPVNVDTVVSVARSTALRDPLLHPYADQKFVVERVERRLAVDRETGLIEEAFQILTLRRMP
jgi:hypothetical protein